MDEPAKGAMAEVSMIVGADSTAAQFARDAGERYPEVLATPVMIGEMERAAAAILHDILTPGQLSVGVRIEVNHLAPTPVGGRVVSRATYTGRDGALYWFDITSEDEGGEIGAGRHARAVVGADVIVARADKRKTKD